MSEARSFGEQPCPQPKGSGPIAHILLSTPMPCRLTSGDQIRNIRKRRVYKPTLEHSAATSVMWGTSVPDIFEPNIRQHVYQVTEHQCFTKNMFEMLQGVTPRTTQPCIPPGSVSEYQL